VRNVLLDKCSTPMHIIVDIMSVVLLEANSTQLLCFVRKWNHLLTAVIALLRPQFGIHNCLVVLDAIENYLSSTQH
jgi:hypothetical protein